MVVSHGAKVFAWAIVVILNLFFVYFSMLRGMQRGQQWQMGFAMACVVQFLVEVLLYETTECMCVNYVIPCAAANEIHSVQYALRRTIDNLCSSTMRDHRYFLDAPNYLFVSVAVAKKFPDLLESIIVRSYHHYLPGELSKKWHFGASSRTTNNRNLRNFSIFALTTSFFQLIGSAPGHIQRMIIHTAQPLLFSAILIVGLFFYKHPVYLAGFALFPLYYCVKYVLLLLMTTDGTQYSSRRGLKFDKIISNVAPSQNREEVSGDVSSSNALSDLTTDGILLIRDGSVVGKGRPPSGTASNRSQSPANRSRTGSNISLKSSGDVPRVPVELPQSSSESSDEEAVSLSANVAVKGSTRLAVDESGADMDDLFALCVLNFDDVAGNNSSPVCEGLHASTFSRSSLGCL